MEVSDSEDSSWLLKNIHRTVYNELDANYGFYKAMFFPISKPIERFYAGIADGCPNLEKLDKNFFAKLVMDEKRRVATARLCLVVLSVLFVPTTIADPTVGLLVIVIAFCAEVRVLSITNRRDRTFLAARCLLLTVRMLERRREYWNNAEFRSKVAAQLEVAASLVGAIPLTMCRNASPRLRRDLLLSGRRKAEAIRCLERTVIVPTPTSYAELVEVLTDDFVNLINGRWYRLPEVDHESKPSRWKFVFRVSRSALVMAIFIITIIIFSSKLGPTSSTALLTIGGAVTLATLKGTGISTESIERYVEVSRKLGPGDGG